MSSTAADKPLETSIVKEYYGEAARRTRRIAVFGPRGSGKTCYFASLYGHCSRGEVSVTIRDDSTELYLQAQWAAYSSEIGFPDPSPAQTPQRLAFDVARSSTNRNWPVEILDHAGALIERGGMSSDDLRALVRRWLQECEAILIFLDTSSDRGKSAIERRSEVSHLLGILREECDTAKIVKPLCLLLTKWDEQMPKRDSTAKASDLVRAYLEAHPAIKEVRNTLTSFGENVVAIPISALGWDRKPCQPPTSPYNLHRPLVWALEHTDRLRFVAAKNRASTASAANAVKAWRDLIRKDGIASGPVFDNASVELSRAKGRLSRQRINRLFAFLCVIGLALTSGWYSWVKYANSEFDTWDSFCKSERGKVIESAQQRAKMAERLLTSFDRAWSDEQRKHLESSRQADQKLALDLKETVEYERIKAGFDRLASGSFADEFILESLPKYEMELVEFGKEFLGGQQQKQAAELLDLLRKQKDEVAERIYQKKERSAYETIETARSGIPNLQLSDEELVERLQRIEQMLTGFGSDFGGKNYGNDWNIALQEVQTEREQTESKLVEKRERIAFDLLEADRKAATSLPLSDRKIQLLEQLTVSITTVLNKPDGSRYSESYRTALVQVKDELAKANAAIEVARDEAEQKAYAEIEQANVRLDHNSLTPENRLEQLKSLANDLNLFGKKFGGKKYGMGYAQLLDRVNAQRQAAEQERDAYESVTKEDERLQRTASEGKNYDKRLRALRTYIEGDTTSRPIQYLQRITAKIERLEVEHDQAMLSDLRSYLGKTPHTYSACVEMLKAAKKRLSEFHNEAAAARDSKASLDAVLLLADEYKYQEAREAVRVARDGIKNKKILLACDSLADYANSPNIEGTSFERPVVMKDQIESQLRWFSEVKRGREFEVNLGSMYVPKGHLLWDNYLDYSDSYSLQASGDWSYDAKTSGKITPPDATSYSKVDGKTVGATIDLSKLQSQIKCGKIKCDLAQVNQKLIVWRQGRGIAGGKWYSNEVTLDSERFLPAQLREGVAVKDSAGKELTIKILTNGSQIPELPEFKAK